MSSPSTSRRCRRGLEAFTLQTEVQVGQELSALEVRPPQDRRPAVHQQIEDVKGDRYGALQRGRWILDGGPLSEQVEARSAAAGSGHDDLTIDCYASAWFDLGESGGDLRVCGGDVGAVAAEQVHRGRGDGGDGAYTVNFISTAQSSPPGGEPSVASIGFTGRRGSAG